MKKAMLCCVLLYTFLMAACSPTQEQIQTAIAQTETAKPTVTFTPTKTLTLTPTPTQTLTVTPTYDYEAQRSEFIEITTNLLTEQSYIAEVYPLYLGEGYFIIFVRSTFLEKKDLAIYTYVLLRDLSTVMAGISDEYFINWSNAKNNVIVLLMVQTKDEAYTFKSEMDLDAFRKMDKISFDEWYALPGSKLIER